MCKSTTRARSTVNIANPISSNKVWAVRGSPEEKRLRCGVLASSPRVAAPRRQILQNAAFGLGSSGVNGPERVLVWRGESCKDENLVFARGRFVSQKIPATPDFAGVRPREKGTGRSYRK